MASDATAIQSTVCDMPTMSSDHSTARDLDSGPGRRPQRTTDGLVRDGHPASTSGEVVELLPRTGVAVVRIPGELRFARRVGDEERPHLVRAGDVGYGLCGHRLRGRWIVQVRAVALFGRELCGACAGSPEVPPRLHAALTALQIHADAQAAEPLRPETARQPEVRPTTVLPAIAA